MTPVRNYPLGPITIGAGGTFSIMTIPEASANDDRPGGVTPASKPGELSRDAVSSGVKTNAHLLTPCLGAARRRNELVPGDYTFTLDWMIQPDGSTRDPRVSSRDAGVPASLTACIATAMLDWRFATSSGVTPVTSFPLGPIRAR